MDAQPMILLAAIAAAVLMATAALLFLLSRRQRQLAGMPGGELVYADTARSEVLVSLRYGIKGKPDALMRLASGEIVPVERKMGKAPGRPYDGDIIQAAAYCLLVEEQFGKSPPFMRIQYADRWFDEPYTPEVRQWVLRTSDRLRKARHAGDCERSHRSPGKCRNCGHRPACGQAL